MKVMLQKLIGVLCCEVPTIERLGRKVLQVRSDDHIRSSLDCGRDNVAIIGIRKPDDFDEIFVSFHECIAHVHVHQIAGPLQLFPREVGAVGKQGVDPLVVDLVRPLGAIEIRNGEFEKQVP